MPQNKVAKPAAEGDIQKQNIPLIICSPNMREVTNYVQELRSV